MSKIFRSVWKKIEESRKDLVEPLNAEVKRINNKYKGWLQLLKEGQEVIDNKLARYKLAEQQAVLAIKEEAHERGLDDYCVVTEREVTRGNLAAASVSEVWDYEVVEEEKVPRAYCVPSAGKLRAAVNAGEREIEGVRIFQKQRLNVR